VADSHFIPWTYFFRSDRSHLVIVPKSSDIIPWKNKLQNSGPGIVAEISVNSIQNIRSSETETPTENTIILLSHHRFSVHPGRWLRQRKYCLLEEYTAVPSLENPRWIFPSRERAGFDTGPIVKPGRIFPRIVMFAFTLLQRIAAGHIIFPGRISLFSHETGSDKSMGMLAESLGRMLSKDELQLTLYAGAPGAYQKITAQVMDKNNSIIAFAKIAHSPLTISRLNRESELLNYAASLVLQTVLTPKVLAFEILFDNTQAFLVTEAPALPGYKMNKFLQKNSLNILFELMKKTLSAQKSEAYIEPLIGQIQGLGDSPVTHLLKPELCALAEHLQSNAPEFIPVCLSHGDFMAWNLLVHPHEHPILIDWEAAKTRCAHWDYWYSVFHSELQLRRKSIATFRKKWLRTLEVPEILCSGSLGEIPSETRKFLRKLFLLELGCQYAQYAVLQHENGFQLEPHINMLLHECVNLLKLDLDGGTPCGT
jgi:hypothetical protein